MISKSKKGNIKKNFIYNSVYQLFVILIPVITTPYLSRVLGPDNIGSYSYAYSIASYFVMFAMMGLNNYGNRTIAIVRDNKEKLAQTFWSIYFMQLFFAILSIVCYVFFAFVFSPHIFTWLMMPYVLSSLLDINWFFFGIEKFKITATRSTLIKLISTILIFVLVKQKSDVYLYCLIFTSGILVNQVLMWPFVKRYVSFKKISFENIRVHIKPNIILFVPVIAVSLYKIMDKIMLGSLSDVNQVGYYANAETIINVPMALINSLGVVMLPRMSNINSKGDKKLAQYYISTSIIFAMMLSTSMCFGIMGVADVFVPIFYGRGFEECIQLFYILMPSCLFIAFANVIRTQYLIPNKEDKIYITSVFLGAIVNIIFNILLIPIFKATGAAIGTFFAEAMVCIYQTIRVRRRIPVSQYLNNVMPLIISGIIMLTVVCKINLKSVFITLVVRVIAGAWVYLLVTIIELRLIKNKKAYEYYRPFVELICKIIRHE